MVFIIDDTGEKINAIKKCFINSSVIFMPFLYIAIIAQKTIIDPHPHKNIVWNDLLKVNKNKRIE